MLGEDVRAVEQPAQAVTLAPVPGARVGGFATGGGVAPHVGMCMAVSERAKVRCVRAVAESSNTCRCGCGCAAGE
jgi:ferredoxin-NADP reductase